MANIREETRQLIQELRTLATSSNTATESLDKLTAIANGRWDFKGIHEFSASVNSLADSLKALGNAANVTTKVDQLRASLSKLVAIESPVNSGSYRIDMSNTTGLYDSVEREVRRRINNAVNMSGLKRNIGTISGDNAITKFLSSGFENIHSETMRSVLASKLSGLNADKTAIEEFVKRKASYVASIEGAVEKLEKDQELEDAEIERLNRVVLSAKGRYGQAVGSSGLNKAVADEQRATKALSGNLANPNITSSILAEKRLAVIAAENKVNNAKRGYELAVQERDTAVARREFFRPGLDENLSEAKAEYSRASSELDALMSELNTIIAKINAVTRLEDELNKTGQVGGGRQGGLTWQDELSEKQKARLSKFPEVTSQEFAKSLGLSDRATGNFQKKLDELGLTKLRVTQNTSELSNGIRSLTLEALDPATGGIRRLSTHIDAAGNILDDTQKRFRSFGDAIVRDTVEVLKWTLAIGLVYGPFRKLQELIDESIKMQSDLVDTQIALGNSTISLGRIFDTASKIAQETSSSLGGVIEGFNEAYAATGSIADPARRAASAQILLRDSMVLSKLSGMDQTKSLDTLVGALRQAGLGLHESSKLLDGWVATSKSANVSIDALASAFAIVGTAAEDVGINFDQLNALVGTLSEATKLSADEVGNAVRGFIAGFQSDTAQAALAKYGIAVRNATGQVRPFMELLKEIAVLKQSGVLNESDVSEMANAVGGGFRRGAQFAALLENFSRVQDLTAVSSNAAGDASQALGLKMETLESATTRLNNEFTKLAQSLGQEGGILSGLTAMTNSLTSVLTLVSSLTKALGAAGPLLAAGGLAKLFAGSSTGQRLLSSTLPDALLYLLAPNRAQLGADSNLFANGRGAGAGWFPGVFPNAVTRADFPHPVTGSMIGAWRGGDYIDLIQGASAYANRGLTNLGGRIAGQAGSEFAGNLGLTGIIGPAIIAGVQAARGDWEEAGASLGGAAIGAFATKGLGIGALFGSMIASALYEGIVRYKPQLTERWAELIYDAELKAKESSGGTTDESPSERRKRLSEDVEKSLNILEKIDVGFKYQLARATTAAAGLFGKDVKQLEKDDIVTAMYLRRNEKLNPLAGIADPSSMLVRGILRDTQPLDKDTLDKVGKLLDDFILQSVENGTIQATQQQAKVSGFAKDVAALAATAAADLVSKSIQEIGKGQQAAIQGYTSAKGLSSSLALSAGGLLGAAGAAQSRGSGISISPAKAVDFITKLTPEEGQEFTKVTSEINNLISRIEVLKNSSEGMIGTNSDMIKEAEAQLSVAITDFEKLYPALQNAITLRSAREKIKSTVELPDGLTLEQQDEFLRGAENRWRDFLAKSTLTDEEINAYIEDQADQLIKADKAITARVTKVPQQFITAQAEAMGLGGKTSDMSFVDLRDKMSSDQWPKLMEMYARWITAFQKNLPGYKFNTEQTGFILKDGFKQQEVDMRILNLAMEELIKVEKDKMVEGMFNLPSGATFMVPFRAAELDAKSRANNATYSWNPESLANQYPPANPLPPYGTQSGLPQGMPAQYWQLASRGAYANASTPEPAKVLVVPDIAKDYYGRKYLRDTAKIPSTDKPVMDSDFNPFPDWTNYSGLKTRENDRPISTALTLNLMHTTTLMVDGKALATALAQYNYQSMLRYEGTAGSVTRTLTV